MTRLPLLASLNAENEYHARVSLRRNILHDDRKATNNRGTNALVHSSFRHQAHRLFALLFRSTKSAGFANRTFVCGLSSRSTGLACSIPVISFLRRSAADEVTDVWCDTTSRSGTRQISFEERITSSTSTTRLRTRHLRAVSVNDDPRLRHHHYTADHLVCDSFRAWV